MPRAKAKGDVSRYLKYYADSDRIGETNDCTVVALAAATDMPYKTAHTLLAQRGRKPRRGFSMCWVEDALNELGFKATRIEAREKIDQYPSPHNNLRGVTSHHPDRFNKVWNDGQRYMFVTPRHVLAVVDGGVVDWSRGRSLRVQYVWRIEKMTETEHQEALKRISERKAKEAARYVAVRVL